MAMKSRTGGVARVLMDAKGTNRQKKNPSELFSSDSGSPMGYGSELCVPSQNGMFFECLHAHQATVPASLISTCFGARPVPLWLPPQNGWLCDLPHAHHQ